MRRNLAKKHTKVEQVAKPQSDMDSLDNVEVKSTRSQKNFFSRRSERYSTTNKNQEESKVQLEPMITPAQAIPKFVVDKYKLGLYNNGGVRKPHVRQQDSLRQSY